MPKNVLLFVNINDLGALVILIDGHNVRYKSCFSVSGEKFTKLLFVLLNNTKINNVSFIYNNDVTHIGMGIMRIKDQYPNKIFKTESDERMSHLIDRVAQEAIRLKKNDQLQQIQNLFMDIDDVIIKYQASLDPCNENCEKVRRTNSYANLFIEILEEKVQSYPINLVTSNINKIDDQKQVLANKSMRVSDNSNKVNTILEI